MSDETVAVAEKLKIPPRKGFWAECMVQHPGEAALLVASYDALSPGEAVAWVKSLFQLASEALVPGPVDAFGPDGDYWGWTARRLSRGEPCLVSVRNPDVAAQWIVTPVIFLPMAGRDDRLLPPCSGAFACPAGWPGHSGCADG
ncbi:hypothetical protein [Streptomyces qinzhouensis]|uniref:Uncharacterized protein n=1 Tax=Streptomyces qinzhouensis TaxID=2599401 RepID=A0A5B8IJK6_9ACTN|nr:hypothetical protein [Streptomyces qinzhouensis]QDY78708.1 hypothetical protein FQU76_21775 [Streptomyces qinzhouensis]